MDKRILFPKLEIVLLRCVGIVLALVSTAALVLLLISLPMKQTPLILTGAAGISLQLCLYLFARSSNSNFKATALILLLLSVTATTAFLESSWQQHLIERKQAQEATTASSFTAQQLQRQIEDINEQIELMLQSTELDINHGYRQRSDQRMDQLDPLHLQRESLLQQLAALNNSNTNDAGAGSFQAIISGLDKNARLAVFSVFAVLLDYTAMLALGMMRQRQQTLPHGDPPVMQFDSAQWRNMLQQRILSGEFGYTPSQRQLIAEVKQVFDTMMMEGLLIKEGKRYKLTDGGPQMELEINE